MKRICIVLMSTLCCFQSVMAVDLLKTETSWDGKAFRYPEGKPQVTSFILHLEEGQVTPWHCHPVPTMGYVLSGSIEVETLDGRKNVMKKGESTVEVMQTVHRGRGLEGGVAIVVFYSGATDVPNTVLHDDKHSEHYCKK